MEKTIKKMGCLVAGVVLAAMLLPCSALAENNNNTNEEMLPVEEESVLEENLFLDEEVVDNELDEDNIANISLQETSLYEAREKASSESLFGATDIGNKAASDKAVKAYIKELRNNKEAIKASEKIYAGKEGYYPDRNHSVAFFDLTGDGIPELLYSYRNEFSYRYNCKIVTYSHGQLSYITDENRNELYMPGAGNNNGGCFFTIDGSNHLFLKMSLNKPFVSDDIAEYEYKNGVLKQIHLWQIEYSDDYNSWSYLIDYKTADRTSVIKKEKTISKAMKNVLIGPFCFSLSCFNADNRVFSRKESALSYDDALAYLQGYLQQAEPNFYPVSIILNTDKTDLVIGHTTKLFPIALPYASEINCKWVSSNPDVVIVRSNGRIKALGIGTAKVVAKSFDGQYRAKAVVKVIPEGTEITRLVGTNKGFIVRWKKQTSLTNGYQIQYSSSKEFAFGRTVTVGKNTVVRKVVGGLKSGRTYYVRVRTFKKTADGKKYYSGWSKALSIKVK